MFDFFFHNNIFSLHNYVIKFKNDKSVIRFSIIQFLSNTSIVFLICFRIENYFYNSPCTKTKCRYNRYRRTMKNYCWNSHYSWKKWRCKITGNVPVLCFFGLILEDGVCIFDLLVKDCKAFILMIFIYYSGKFHHTFIGFFF